MSKKLIALIFYFFLHSAFAQSVPLLINYQGMLTDSEGKPLVGTKKLTFNIYASADATDLIWGPQVFTTVPLINGQFNVILGTTDTAGRSLATAFSGSNRYLGIIVDNGTEIIPRQQVLSAPYAMKSMNADNAINATNADHATNATNANMLGNGVVTINNNNVGVGTLSPSVKLDVAGQIRSREGTIIYSCPALLPISCHASSSCQSMCTGQLQINKSTCTRRGSSGVPTEVACTLVGRLVAP